MSDTLKTPMLDTTINVGPGFSLDFAMDAEELDLLRRCIQIQWLYRLQLLAPQHVGEFARAGIDKYHTCSHLIDHACAWPKTARVVPREVVQLLRERQFLRQLATEFGPFEISDEENFGWENIYWRLVRPGNSDVGSLHSDKWFWDLGYGTMPNYPCERVKVWIAIYTAPGKNGLLVVPGSHRRDDWKWHAEERFGMKKPVFDENLEDLDVQLVETRPGQAIVFHDKLLHGGAANMADTCRVSIEFTCFVKR